jgi:Ca2+-binding RTX toxin-like protein
MPLSRMTIGTLQDMGYTVSYATAETFTVPIMAGLTEGAGLVMLSEADAPLPTVLAPAGFTGTQMSYFDDKPLNINTQAPGAIKLDGAITQADANVAYFFETTTGNSYLVQLTGEFDRNNPATAAALKGSVTGMSISGGLVLLENYDFSGSPRDVQDLLTSYLITAMTGSVMISARASVSQDDVITTGPGDDALYGGLGNDLLSGAGGGDLLDGGAGIDTAVFDVTPDTLRIRDAGNARLTVEGGSLGSDTLIGIEGIRTQDGIVSLQADLSGLFRTSVAGDSYMLLGRTYVGPVAGLERELFGSAAGEVFGGTAGNDFMNLFAGDDAANGGAGNDVIDGGLGSNFLTGGAGRDIFFSDGRGGGVTWTTITDWQAGEQLSVWGWQPGTSRVTWLDSDGVGDFKGVTMHGDLNGDGVFDTSVTWSGMTRAGLPTPLEFGDPPLLWFIG